MPDIYIFAVFPSDFEIELSSMNTKHPPPPNVHLEAYLYILLP